MAKAKVFGNRSSASPNDHRIGRDPAKLPLRLVAQSDLSRDRSAVEVGCHARAAAPKPAMAATFSVPAR